MPDKIKIEVIPAPEIDRSFQHGSNGWLGGDCAFSLPLAHDRVLWLFGDSFIQEKNRWSREGAGLINNSIAIQQGKTINTDSLHFYWNQHNGQHRAFFVNENEPGFLWPLSAIRVAAKLFVFCVRIQIVDPANVFGFRQIGNEIFCIENPDDPPDHWKMNVHKLPFQRSLGSFGSNFLVSNDYVYIYGYRNLKSGWDDADIHLIIARIKPELANEIYNQDHWEYLDGGTGNWHRDIHQLKPVLEHFTTEFSVTFVPGFGKYVLVANAWKHPHPITVRWSDSPYGPFSEPKIIYHCPEIDWSPNYFCYAAKAHPELAEADNELVVSYMTNSKAMWEVFEDLRIYFPRFLKIVFDMKSIKNFFDR